LKLWLVRHAQPLVAPGVCYGATDVPADAQATFDVAQALAQALPQGLAVHTSSLQRCELLKRILQALRPDLSYKSDARLAEMNFGLWEGQRWDAIAADELKQWTDNFSAHACGGAESVGQFMARVGAGWDEAAAQKQDTVWLTHAGVIRAATLLSQGIRTLNDAKQWPQQAPGFGQWCVVDV
jgi:alpha-ribazole phosphatase